MIRIPPRLGFCASCVEDHPDLELAVSEHGRLVWLCPRCRSDIGRLEQYAGWHPGGELAVMGMRLCRSRRSRLWVQRASAAMQRIAQLIEGAGA